MGIQEIRKSYIYTCDACGKEHIQKNAKGYYSDSRPPHWSRLVLNQDAHDFQGAAVADGTIKRLLCEDCTPKVAAAVNAAIRKGE